MRCRHRQPVADALHEVGRVVEDERIAEPGLKQVHPDELVDSDHPIGTLMSRPDARLGIPVEDHVDSGHRVGASPATPSQRPLVGTVE